MKRLTIILLILCFSAVAFAQDYEASTVIELRAKEKEEPLTVKKVKSCKEIVLSNGEKIRLIGISTPKDRSKVRFYGGAVTSIDVMEEIENRDDQATDFTRGLCQGKKVTLEYDEANSETGNRTKDGETLAYVYLEDGTFVNAQIIKAGYGYVDTDLPFGYMSEFLEYDEEAEKKKVGLRG